MKITCKGTRVDYEVNFSKYSGTESATCPACSAMRKNPKQKCFNWNHNEKLGKCHNCGNAFYVSIEKKKIEKKYIKPTFENNTELSDKAVKYFEGRGISQFVLRQMKVTTGYDYMPQFPEHNSVETIRFNYYRDEELINIKYRAPNKSFKLFKDGELILYNLNAIKWQNTPLKSAVIVEGEVDCLSYVQAGVANCVSVPNGAKNFEFLENCWELIDSIEIWFIAVDSDESGIGLRNELIRRIGSERCRLVDFKDKKDANDYLKAYGEIALKQTIEDAKEIPVDGIVYVNQVWDSLIHEFRHGKKYGTTTYFNNLDNHWKWRAGEVNIFTGYNNEGKSCFYHQLCVLKAVNEGWRFALFCPENFPINDIIDELIHCYIGKSTDKRYSNCMREEEYIEGATFVNNHFFFVMPEENLTLDTILSAFKFLIRKYGVKACSIDPYNQIEHQMERGEREDLYISRFMSKLKRFSVSNDIALTLIAHQVTPNFQGKDDYPQPDIYKIKGGGTFADKADNVMAVWRPFRKSNFDDTTVKVIIGKIKKQKLVGVPGETEFK